MHLDVNGNALSIVLQLKFNEASPFCSTRAVRCYRADSLLLSLPFSCHLLAFFSSSLCWCAIYKQTRMKNNIQASFERIPAQI